MVEIMLRFSIPVFIIRIDLGADRACNHAADGALQRHKFGLIAVHVTAQADGIHAIIAPKLGLL